MTRRRRRSRALASLGLAVDVARPAAAFSTASCGAWRSRALLRRPRLLVLDSPTPGSTGRGARVPATLRREGESARWCW